jgi:hypothetical protein
MASLSWFRVAISHISTSLFIKIYFMPTAALHCSSMVAGTGAADRVGSRYKYF